MFNTPNWYQRFDVTGLNFCLMEMLTFSSGCGSCKNVTPSICVGDTELKAYYTLNNTGKYISIRCLIRSFFFFLETVIAKFLNGRDRDYLL